MKRLVMGFMWLVVFMLLLVVLDQVLLRYRGFEQPFLRDVQEFHADFRRRLFGSPREQLQETARDVRTGRTQSAPAPRPEGQGGRPADAEEDSANVDAVVEREITRVTQQALSATQDDVEDGSLRYIYLDAEQNIQFAERYEEIPPQFRDAVQVVED